MASYSIFCFHFLLSCFTLLVLAAAGQVEEYPEECYSGEPCGYLGHIYFPFTKSYNPKCGLQIRGCENDAAVKEIELEDTWYKIYKIHELSIFIDHEEGWPLKLPLNTAHITGFKCHKGKTPEDHDPNKMFTYRDCSDYDICFSPCPDAHDVPQSPLPMFMLPFTCLLHDYPLIDECEVLFSVVQIDLPPSCKDCFDYEHHCHYEKQNYTCVHYEKPNQTILKPIQPSSPTSDMDQNLKAKKIALSVGIPSLVAVVILSVILLLLIKRRNKYSGLKNQTRSAHSASFKESGAVYLGIPIFSYEDLERATNNFDQTRELGEGGFGTVYYGKLQDGREVAVKRLFERNYRPVESFINEIQILTRLRHRNLVSLYGCTSRHSRELLLVYEYIPNGTVSSHLYNDDNDQAKPCKLPWNVRMKIAIETAGALAYLHASDVIHRDVKTSNILIDNDFGVKVADFGLSRLFPDDATHVSTAPRGTPGYVDPDYRICYKLTTKSDVYSFGVVLVELISSLRAVDINRSRDDILLANVARRKIQEGAFCELVDPSLGFQSDEKLKRMIVSVAELAFRCLQGDKELRPSMGEVLEVLQKIQSGREEPRNLEGIEVHDDRVCQSYAHPPLPNSLIRPEQRLHQTR